MKLDLANIFSDRYKLLTPGPTPVPLEVRRVSLRDPIYHRSNEFASLLLECRERLAKLFQTKSQPLILTSSGTGALEAALVNFTDPEDEVLVIKGGKFGERWQKIAETYGCRTYVLDVANGQAANPEIIASYVRSNPQLKALFIQASETSTGIYHPLEEICKAVRAIHKELIIVVDAVSAICAHDIKMDDWGIDIMVSGSQKGFGVPPGLSFIAVADHLWSKISATRPRFYFDLRKEAKGQAEGLTAWTPATTLIEQLHLALEKLCEWGPEYLARYHQRFSYVCRQTFIENNIPLFAVTSPSYALTSFLPPYNLSAQDIARGLKERYGFQIAGGQDELKGKILRLAHLGFINDFSLIEAMAAMDFVLADLCSEHRAGSLTSTLVRLLQENKLN